MLRIFLFSIVLIATTWSYSPPQLASNPSKEEESDYEVSSSYSPLKLKWGKISEWNHVGGQLEIECILEGGEDFHDERFGNSLDITCPRCGTRDATSDERYDDASSQLSRTVTITNVTKEDHGWYVCNHYSENELLQSINMTAEIASTTGQIKINSVSNTNIVVRSGETFSLHVNISVYPSLYSGFSATWIREYSTAWQNKITPITNDSRHVLHEKQSRGNQKTLTLTVNGAQTNFSGIYVLVIRILDTEERIKFQVSVLSDVVQQKLIIFNHENYILLGQKYYKPGTEIGALCSAESLPLPIVKLSYRFLNNPGTWISVKSSRLNGTYESAIKWNMVLNETIEVNCEAALGDKTRNELTTIRAADGIPSVETVINKSRLATGLEEEDIIYEGDGVVLKCKYPKDTEWIWTFNGEKLETNLDIEEAAVSKIMAKTLTNVTTASAGEYNCVPAGYPRETMKLNIAVQKIAIPNHVESERNKTMELQFGQDATLTCQPEGEPQPQIYWYKDGEPYTQGILKDKNRTLYIPRVAPEDMGEFVCRAVNRAGEAEAVFHTTVLGEPKRLTPFWLSSISGALLFLIACLLIFGCIICKQRRNTSEQKKALSILYDQLMKEAKVTLPTKEQSLDKNVSNLPYKKEYEVDREMLTIGDRKLGEGFFGLVWAGRLNRSRVAEDDDKLPVAIKSPKNAMNPEDNKALADELRILCAIGKHPNVLALVGAVTKNMINGEFYVIVEFCEHGDLKKFLETRRFKFVNELRAVNITVGDYITADNTKVQRYASELDQQWAEDAEQDRLLPDSTSLTTSDLLSFGMQVAQGMEYLSSRPCIHRDLAARNILITSNFVCRIADFGLAKQENRDYYRLKTNIPLPRRWMSIEAIEDGLFTVESDVWSFGILLYEIFTLGGKPYPAVSDDNLLSLSDKLKEGHRSPKPNYCHDEIYALMQQCWQEQPTRRPTFAQCAQLLKGHLEGASPQLKERVEKNIREDATKQNNLARWIAQNSDYREHDQDTLPRKENGETTGCFKDTPFNWKWRKLDERELIIKTG